LPELQQRYQSLKVGDFIILYWVDIVGHDSAWVSKKEAKEMKPLEMVTAARVVSKTKTHITIASTWCTSDPDTWGNLNCIPFGVIKKISRDKWRK